MPYQTKKHNKIIITYDDFRYMIREKYGILIPATRDKTHLVIAAIDNDYIHVEWEDQWKEESILIGKTMG